MIPALLIAVLLQQEPSIQQAWAVEFEDAVLGAPQGAGDLVYVATHTGKVTALKADTGDRAWSVDTQLSVVAHVVIMKDRVFVPGYPAARILDAKTGKVVQEKGPVASRAFAGNSRIYLLDSLRWYSGQLHLNRSPKVAAFEVTWGKAAWEEEFRGGVSAIVETGGKLYLSAENKIVALDSGSGRKVSEESLFGFTALNGLADQGRLFFFGGGASTILHLDAKTLKEKWRFKTDGTAIIPPIVHGGRIILFPLPDVIAVDSKTGKEAWRVAVEGQPHFSTVPPAVRGGEICVGFKGVLYGIDAAAGKNPWFLGTGGLDQEVPVSQPVWIGDRLYYAVGRRLLCFKPK